MMMNITIVLLVALGVAYGCVRIGLPIVVAYIVTGIMVGPSVLKVIDDPHIVSRIGEIGVVMLLFFVGMEVSIPKLMRRWRIAVIGTLFQIAVSVAACLALVWLLKLPMALGILFGFVISLSSTAVVLKELQDAHEMEEPFGQNAIGVLLVQDMAIVPMMIVLSLMGEGELNVAELSKQLIGGMAIVGLVVWLMRRGEVQIPAFLTGSVEKRVLLGLLLCLGAATLTSWLGLSPGLGAFLAGMVIVNPVRSRTGFTITWSRST